MALNLLKIPPQGLDRHIQRAQGILYRKLMDRYADALTSQDDYECYGRIYKTQRKDDKGTVSLVPEAYVNAGEYREVLLDDRKTLITFFTAGDNTLALQAGNILKASLSLTVIADTCALCEANHRADEELRRNVYNIYNGMGLGIKVKNITTGIDNVFREYSGPYVKNSMYARDMQYHFFRIDADLTYYPEQQNAH